MIRRLLELVGLAAAALAIAASPAAAQTAKPIVLLQGEFHQIPSSYGVQLQPATTSSPSLNIPCAGGVAPTSPNDGDTWCTTAGLYIRVGSTTVGPLGSGGGGGVSSVGLSLPSIFTVSGSPVTSSGTLTGALANEGANLVFAGPSSGSPAAPTFRALVGADLPAPGASSLGGVESFTCASHQWANSISTLGVPGCSQPSFADLSGNIAPAQMNSGSGASSTTFWRGDGTWASVASAGACTNPCAIGSAQIGVDSATGNSHCLTSVGEGSICLDDVNGVAYSMWGASGAAPSYVQAKGATSFTVTLTSTPTVGNMLVANCYSLTALPTQNTGWTSFGTQPTSSGDEPYVNSLWHLVTGADTTTQTPCTNAGGATAPGATVMELSGIDPAWTSSFTSVSYQVNTAFAPGTISVTTSHTTGAANSIAIAGAGSYSSGNTAGNNLSFNSGWANTVVTGATTNPVEATAEQSVSGASTSITATATNPNPSGSSQIGITVVLIELQPNTNAQLTGWQPLSYFTTFDQSGSAITTNARSFNCSTGLTCTSDAQGNVTATSGFSPQPNAVTAAVFMNALGGL